MVFWKSFLLPRFFLVKMHKTTFLKIKGFRVKCFIKLKMRAAMNWSSHLKEHQTFDVFSNDIIFTQFSL